MTQPTTTCRRCHGAGLLARGAWLRTCRRCRGTGRARPWTAERLYRYLERCGIVLVLKRRPGARRAVVEPWTAGQILVAPWVLRRVRRHRAGLLALLAADCPPPPPGVRAARAPVVDEGPLR